MELAWSLQGGRFILEWRERGGPVVPPPTRSCFRRRLPTAGLPRQLDAEASLNFDRSGVAYVLAAPATALES